MYAVGYTYIDSFSSECGDDYLDVLGAIDDGRTIIGYRGQALCSWWSPFNVNPYSTDNGWMLPFIISPSCYMIDYSGGSDCGERWLKAGSIGNPQGGIGFCGTTYTGSGIAGQRSAMMVGTFDGLFDHDSAGTAGFAVEKGREKVYNDYGSLAHYHSYLLIGDPELRVWTGDPQVLSVTHPDVVPLGPFDIDVTVSTGTGAPVRYALVCVMNDDSVYSYGYTDPSGQVTLHVNATSPDTLDLTVTGKNCRPYETTILAISSGAYVAYLSHAIDDITGGNGDGLVNPGETIDLEVWAKNWGNATALDVIGDLDESSSFAALTVSTSDFGDVPSGDTSLGVPDYRFQVLETCTNRHLIPFTLTCRDEDDSTWVSGFGVTVSAPDIRIVQVAVDDTDQAIPNGRLDPGETVDLVVTLQNDGHAELHDAHAVLRTVNPEISLLDSSAAFGDIPVGDQMSNESDPLTISASYNLEAGAEIRFTLRLMGADDYTKDIIFSLYVGGYGGHVLIWDPDENHNSGSEIWTILDSLGFDVEYTTSLTGFRDTLYVYDAVFVCVGVWPYNYVIPAGSPDAESLGSYIENHGGSAYLEGGDVWYYDPMSSGHDFGPVFHINPTADGSSDISMLAGMSGTFTQGMSFSYGGENSYMDHIDQMSGSQRVFVNPTDNGYHGVAYNAGSYRTVGASFELGELSDGISPSIRAVLLDSIMRYFGIRPGVPGDADGDGDVDADDIGSLIDYLFFGGPSPTQYGDVQGDGIVDVQDVSYLVNYLYFGGAAPDRGTRKSFHELYGKDLPPPSPRKEEPRTLDVRFGE
jgi:hypothetical protein